MDNKCPEKLNKISKDILANLITSREVINYIVK